MANLFSSPNAVADGVENPISMRKKVWGLRSVCCAGTTVLFAAAAVGGAIWGQVSRATIEDNNKDVFDTTPWDGDTCGNIFSATLAKYSEEVDACEDLYYPNQLEGTSCGDVLKKYCDAELDLFLSNFVLYIATAVTVVALAYTVRTMCLSAGYCGAEAVKADGLNDPLNEGSKDSEDPESGGAVRLGPTGKIRQ